MDCGKEAPERFQNSRCAQRAEGWQGQEERPGDRVSPEHRQDSSGLYRKHFCVPHWGTSFIALGLSFFNMEIGMRTVTTLTTLWFSRRLLMCSRWCILASADGNSWVLHERSFACGRVQNVVDGHQRTLRHYLSALCHSRADAKLVGTQKGGERLFLSSSI